VIERKDGKYLLTSLTIHFLLLANLAGLFQCSGGVPGKAHPDGKPAGQEKVTQQHQDDFKKIVEKNVEVTLVDAPPPDKKGIFKREQKKETKHSKDGYWGIGVYQSGFVGGEVVFYNGLTYWGDRVSAAVKGNPAERAGIQTGDLIFMIDNQPLSVKNQVRGDGPRSMVLMIKRGNSFIEVSIERAWIETYGKSHSPAQRGSP